jgi:hypothetical protein
MNRKLMGNLAKVLAAAGWADKRLTSTEIENLKDLLSGSNGTSLTQEKMHCQRCTLAGERRGTGTAGGGSTGD